MVICCTTNVVIVPTVLPLVVCTLIRGMWLVIKLPIVELEVPTIFVPIVLIIPSPSHGLFPLLDEEVLSICCITI